MQGLAPSEIFLFEDFRLDRRGGLFRRDDTGAFVPVAIGSRALDILGVLIARAGEVVSKEELIAAVWLGTVVEDSNLTVQISALRRVLDRGWPNGSYIQTVSGRGYRFIAPVTRPKPEVLPASPEPDPGSEERRPGSRSALSAAASTRRLAAILAADIAGYSWLMDADEEGTLARLKALHVELIDPTIAAHNGRLVKTTGDGLLVEFGSVLDALQCAIEVQAGMAQRNAGAPADKRIEYRIGINMGDIVVEDGDIFGDGVNVAARLEGLAAPGGICVSARVQEDAVGKLDLAFEDMGEQALKNIARPVTAYRIANGSVSATTQQTPALALPDKPSVAVLPFTNMSADPEQEFFADGIAEDVITALSRYPSLFVIARNSCFTYKGRAVNVKEIGRELGVRYVLGGSLRKSANRIRVTTQLVEAESGKHVWAERYDRELADIFAVQGEIAEAVTVAITPAIADAELHRALRKPPENLDAWAAYQRGLWNYGKFTADDNVVAQNCFQQAIDLDPYFVGGYWGLIWAQLVAASIFRRRNLVETLRSAETLARRAVALDSQDPEARVSLGLTSAFSGDYEGGLAEIKHALAASPNWAVAHAALGYALIWSGRPKEGLAALQSYFRLDPRDPSGRAALVQAAIGHYFCREYDAAIDALKQVIRSYPDFPLSYRWLAAALGQAGQIEEARETLEKAIAIAPASSDRYPRGRPPWFRLQDHAHFLEGLRKAGWEG
jgi:adenylate cyclase